MIKVMNPRWTGIIVAMAALLLAIVMVFIMVQAAQAQSGPGNCLDFDGVDDYVITTLDAQPTAMTETTWEAWIKPTRINHATWQSILSTDDGGWDRAIWITTGADTFTIGCGDTGPWVPPVTVDTEKWHHIALAYSASNVLFYFDGVEYSRGLAASGQSTTNPFTMGYPYEGQLDEVRIWDMVRSGTEILENMNQTLTGSESGLVAYYQFDESSGSILPDIVGTNSGTLTNMNDSNWQESYAIVRPVSLQASNVGYTSFSARWIAPITGLPPTAYYLDVATDNYFTSFVPGYQNLNVGTVSKYQVNGLVVDTDYFYRVRAYSNGSTGQSQSSQTIWTKTTPVLPPGNCLNFDGLDDSVTVGSFPALAENHTIEFWIKYSELAGDWEQIMAKQVPGSDRSPGIWSTPDAANIHWRYQPGNVGSWAVGPAGEDSDFSLGQWYHVAGVKSGTRLTVYVDGCDVATATVPNPMANGTGSFILGTTASPSFDGSLDEVRIWDMARSGTEIRDNMNQSITGNEAGLVAYYQFDNDSETNLPDQAGFNDGTLNNMDNSDWQKSYALVRPGSLAASDIDYYSFTANWTAPALGGTPTAYFLDVATDSGFTSMVSGYDNLNVGTVTSYLVDGLELLTDYFYQVSAYRSGTAEQSQSSETVSVTTDGCKLNITIDPIGSGTVSLSPPGGHYEAGTIVTLTGSPSAGYAFTEWAGDLTTTINPGIIMMGANKDITAHFTGYNLNVAIDPPGSGIVTLDPPGGLYPPGTVVTITGSPSAGYAFTEWTGDLATTINPGTIMINADKDITAHFTGYTLNVAIDPPGSGIVTLDPPGGLYPPGTVVTLTGTSIVGCVFNEWTGDLTGSLNPGTVMMNSDKNVTAHFFNPYVISLFPADNQTSVALNSDLVINFNIPIVAGTGNITIKRTDDDSTVETIAASATTISGSRVTINPVSNLESGTGHYVLIDSDAFHDGFSNYYGGISDKETWNFQTGFFTDIGAALAGVFRSSVAWGDYDNDGDLDILLTGSTGHPNSISKIYQNNSGIFTDIEAGLIGVFYSSAAWGDYDNDGDLDILLTGLNMSLGHISRVYKNESGTFTDISAGLIGVYHSSAAWGDYDNDGDLDILLTGDSNPGSGLISRVYKNESGTFTDISAGLAGVLESSVAWGDYDNDGDLDILLTGYDGTSQISKVYRNDSGSFTDIGAGLQGIQYGSAAWGDYDNDGDLDIFLSGCLVNDCGTHISKVYRNDAGSFTDIGASLPGVGESSAAWGDYDSDGDLDILLNGTRVSPRVYENESGGFTDIGVGLQTVYYGSAAWGDYDNDGDLDILLTGGFNDYGSSNYVSEIYRNESIYGAVPFQPNPPPSPPSGLTVETGTGSIAFGWNPGTDAQTPQDGLTYNMRVGTSTYGSEICSPHSGTATGYRHVPQLGNTNHSLSWKMNLYYRPHIVRYWSVQAIDTAFAGSAFAPEKILASQLGLSNPSQMTGDDLLTWEIQYLDEIENYQVQIDDNPAFGSPEVDDLVDPHLNQVQPAGMGAMAASSPEPGISYSVPLNSFTSCGSLTAGNTYYWRLRPIYENWPNTAFTWEDIPWFNFMGDTFAPLITACNDTGMEQNWFRPTDIVYVKGEGLQANTVYKIWVQNNPITEGQSLAVISPPENNDNPINTVLVETDSNGDFVPTAIWTIPSDSLVTSTRFDIVVDYGGGSGYYNASTDGLDTFTTDANITERLVEIKLDLQGSNRPPSGWEVPINIGFYPTGKPDSWLLNPGSATYYFSGTTAAIIDGGTRAYFSCPQLVLSGTYDITTDSTTTLLNVKRSVSIQ